MTWKPPASGALDDTAWPMLLVGRAIAPGPSDARIHGYAALGDIAHHYRYSDLLYLVITRELPDDRTSALFHVALFAWAPAPVTEAPVHVAILSRICGGSMGSAFAAGTIALVEQVRAILEQHAPLLTWLQNPQASIPEEFAGSDSVSVCEALERRGYSSRFAMRTMTKHAAGITLLYEAGLRSAEQQFAAIVAARTNSLIAEALTTGPGDLGDYPVKLPPFHYVEEAR